MNKFRIAALAAALLLHSFAQAGSHRTGDIMGKIDSGLVGAEHRTNAAAAIALSNSLALDDFQMTSCDPEEDCPQSTSTVLGK